MSPKYQKTIPPSTCLWHREASKVASTQIRAAVRRFDGFIDNSSIEMQITALKTSLQAAIDHPYEFDNRVNEVMLWFD